VSTSRNDVIATASVITPFTSTVVLLVEDLLLSISLLVKSSVLYEMTAKKSHM
jgi:hypothetical protein